MNLTFEAWLLAQHNREDVMGIFARKLDGVELPSKKMKKGKNNEHARWVEIVIEMEQPAYITIFNDAWQEYLAAKSEGEM